MERFIRNDQYNEISNQAQILLNGYSTVNDLNVLHALRGLVKDKVNGLFTDLTVSQEEMLSKVEEVKDSEQAEDFLLGLEPYILPFPPMTEAKLKKLFPKVKKLKMPDLSELNETNLTYLGWNDYGQERKYLVVERDGKLTGLKGRFTPSNKKGICAICHSFSEIGMFMSESKKSQQGTYVNRGNYICQDSVVCNTQVKSLERLHDFQERMKS
ncbi:FusB/FusC family EF-G-binding protein [Rossellomorea marisflavi]|uniref:Elongation factor G-binding protein n=1 Tax=Rossellomorea marisflavi TaxID=189381 RepID=A0A0J5SV10_9BACI|nr:elongation factor G-binding protein [Rossellomorea marisflavi]KMK97148.1 ferrous iron transporter A [Rossellomorea marisflavi]KML00694.1 ferrous iron transporter A [Rossellomorea marisflavi]KZE45169.1 elongation factor G-binding protein [Rossellomorea marisflavi]MCM2604439.1 elongation factor G-binding protein [Rossellomorea marisflavi]QHA36302.1 elongation factor G-binding protein [Rossellomorea marisflavi]